MDDFASKLLEEEADLERKLTAIRAMKAAYGIGGAAPAKEGNVTVRAKAPRQARNTSSRMDKFGSYGQHIIDTALQVLPGSGSRPVMTRHLVDQLAQLNVEVRGENKVNALSALLARSSKIKGHGRAGWTRASEEAGSLYPRIGGGEASPRTSENQPINIDDLLGGSPQDENEPRSTDAGGSETALHAQTEGTTE